MTHIIRTIIILLLILPSSCNNRQKSNNSVPIVDIEANIRKMVVLNLSEFTENIRYIPLEMNQDNQIGNIQSIDFSEEYFLINDYRSCFLYDTEGHFKRIIGKMGRGPGEYQYLTCVRLSDDRIFIQSLFDLIEYKTDGSFVKNVKNRFLFANNKYEYTRNWIIFNDSMLFSYIPNPTGNIKYKALLTNDDGEKIKSYANYLFFKVVKPFSNSADNAHIYQFDKRIYFKEHYNDTLFYLNSQFQLIPEYVFNLGKYKEPLSAKEKPLSEYGKSVPNFIYIPNVFQTDKNLIIVCQLGNHFPAKRLTPKITHLPNGEVVNNWRNTDRVLVCFNKETKTISFCKPTSTDNPLFTSGIYNDIDAGPRFFPVMQVNDSTMIMWIKANDLKNHVASDDFKNSIPKFPGKKRKLEELAKRLTEFDNPIIMFVTFKK